MEWFWKMVDHLQKSVAGSALQSFAPIDWIVVIAIFWGLVQGSRKGFSNMFGKLLTIFLVSMLTLSFYKIGTENLAIVLPIIPMEAAEFLSFFLFSICLWLIVSRCIDFFGKLFKVEAQGILRTLGGMVFGVLRTMLLLSFLVQFLLFFPIKPMQQAFKQGRTYTGYTVSRLVPDLYELVVSPFSKSTLKKSVETSKVGG